MLQDADVALQETSPDGDRRVVLAASRRAAGHRRHLLLLLLPPPRLRVAPAAADAAVHEQQAGAHGGESQADGQPVALRGAERGGSAPGAAGSPRRGAQRGAPLPVAALVASASFMPADTAKVREVGNPLPPSFLPRPPRRLAPAPPCLPASLSPRPASSTLLPSVPRFPAPFGPQQPSPPQASHPCILTSVGDCSAPPSRSYLQPRPLSRSVFYTLLKTHAHTKPPNHEQHE